MSPPWPSSRRSFLHATGAAVFAGVAGCLGRPKYDAEALREVLEDPIPRPPPASLPLPDGYLGGARDTAERSAAALAERLSSLPDDVSPDSLSVERASNHLKGGRASITESTQQQSTDAMRSIREARSTLSEGRGWLDTAVGKVETDALWEHDVDLGRVLARSWTDVEYRATTVPVGIYAAAETEALLLEAGSSLESVDRALIGTDSVDDETERYRLFAAAMGELSHARAALADANAVIGGQRERVFEGTPSLRDPMATAAQTLLETTEADIESMTPVSDEQPRVVHEVLDELSVRPPRDVRDALDANRPATALSNLRWRRQRLTAREGVDRESLSVPESNEALVSSRRAAIDALRQARSTVGDPVEHTCIRQAQFEAIRGDRDVENVANEVGRSESRATEFATRGYAHYVAAKHLATAAKPTATRLVSAVENELGR
ncbi:hypothetical protein GJR96_13135 [Haloferax sp. MBLA0076]|uniref:Uncharacterized protein n=1 Tax=Haloferax litoreum TaxID=2666140 RepID=A0A6A8GKB5_9EURY|nr:MULTISPECIES: hypothetical protein [Haloferax]KAB1194331.1 hypothetical protein Hfx1148_13075 [Haloferax sp. CBA1148]MRX22892.1 hypothetical protein [Haloferax litoreum]